MIFEKDILDLTTKFVCSCHLKKLVAVDGLQASGSSWGGFDLLLFCEKDLLDKMTTSICSYTLVHLV
jgi:hypothetical protein